MALEFKTPRGTKDILPADISKWQYVESTLREIFERYNFSEIRTPTFEETELFARGIGQATDIVQKEMYTFEDKGGKSHTLRPEMTASVMRAYLEHHLGEKRALQKLYYISPMFRQERPQAGRFREFNQYGIEIIGTQNPLADVESIILAVEILRALGVQKSTLKLNSVGCQNCRPKYKEILRQELKPVFSDLCNDCQKRYHANPLRILDCKRDKCGQITESISPIYEYLCEECATHFDKVQEFLRSVKTEFVLDRRLVRGLDYYTKTAFEVISDLLGSQDSICGGGRYDYLAEEFGGKHVPAVGFAAGTERLITVLEKSDLLPAFGWSVGLYLVSLGDAATKWAFKEANELRRAGISCEIDYEKRSLKAQMRDANRLNVRMVAIVGEEELNSGMIVLKNMDSGEQESVSANAFRQVVIERLNRKTEPAGSPAKP
ncbi:MAG: histidine--tRNA ligase [bacterium]